LTIYFFFCLLPLPNTIASPTRFLCRPDQRDALLELKKEFPVHSNDSDPVTTVSWNKSVDCCSWDGVTCDANLGNVISLQLISRSTATNTSLKSSSRSLLKLQHLRELRLSICNLQGEIPSSIGNLSHLTYLDLSDNQLVGEVPASIGNLNQLKYMSMWGNHLRVDIELDENQFEGTLDFGNTSSSSKLGVLTVGDNNFDGLVPESIGKLHNLNSLDLSQNNFRGRVPRSIWKLRHLNSLDLSHNNFIGRVPRSISKLVNLNSIDLSYNKFEGQIPHHFWRPSQVGSGHVMLSHNSFTGFGKPVEIIDGTTLERLDLGSNSLQGTFPLWMCKFRALITLDLSNNHFSGSIPQCLKNLTQLRVLNLRNNSLSGFLPDFDGFELESLDVSHNNLMGKLPKSLINCRLLEFLNVKGNKINDMFPFWLGSLQYLNVLMLGSNAFYGPVYNPSTYVGFPNLQIIDISNNNFVGSLPQDYFSNWTVMSLVWKETVPENNYMGLFASYSMDMAYKGADTDFDRIFRNFKAIDFSGNRFSGHIPTSIGLLSEMRLLNLSDNTFTGNIPPSLANITKLEILDLSRNNLSGEIPRGLDKLSFLSYINFSHNHLQGLVPQSTQFGSQNCSSFLDNNGLYGLEEICGKHHVPVPTAQQQPEESLLEPEEPVLNWIAAAIAFGPCVFCGLVIGHIFTSYKHEWFYSS
ncbi:Leucine-rich repeat, partial [Arabidopsis suecica]